MKKNLIIIIMSLLTVSISVKGQNNDAKNYLVQNRLIKELDWFIAEVESTQLYRPLLSDSNKFTFYLHIKEWDISRNSFHYYFGYTLKDGNNIVEKLKPILYKIETKQYPVYVTIDSNIPQSELMNNNIIFEKISIEDKKRLEANNGKSYLFYSGDFFVYCIVENSMKKSINRYNDITEVPFKERKNMFYNERYLEDLRRRETSSHD